MKENLKMIITKEKGFFIGIVVNGKEIDMKENLKMIRKKEKVFIIFRMGIDMMVIGKMI